MDFSDALRAMKHEKVAVARKGWNGKGMFLYAVPGAAYASQTGVAKEHWGPEAFVPYGPYLAIKGTDGIVNPWLASQQDLFADDWQIVDVDGIVRPI